jgi:putative transposase
MPGDPGKPHRGWHRRGYMPHFDVACAIQSITYRLADALPREVLSRCEAAIADEPEGGVTASCAR